MIRILFVDDEEHVLAGLRRSMHCMRHEWRVRYATSGQAALAEMAAESADVVVTDMRMPGMNGTQLLSEIMRLYPEAVRIVLSGQAEPESIVRATRTAHQYLSKPCDAPALKAAISRTQALRALLSSGRLAAIVGSVDALPSPPRSYQELLASLRDPAASLASIVDIIRRDVAMTAKIVKLANSGFFGIRSPVQSVERAVGLVGMDAIATLVLGHELFGVAGPVGLPGFDIEGLGRHSFETAAWARAIALHECLSANVAEAAFLAGTLHDVGKLVFATRAPPASPAGNADWLARSRSQMETYHAEVGAYLLGLWCFPELIVEAIAWHHAPAHCGLHQLGLCGVVHVADVLAHEFSGSDTCPPAVEPGYLEQLGLADHWSDWRALRAGESPHQPLSATR